MSRCGNTQTGIGGLLPAQYFQVEQTDLEQSWLTLLSLACALWTWQVVSVLVPHTDVVLVDGSHRCLPSQLLPQWHLDPHHPIGSISRKTHRLFWKAEVPPLGLAVYFVGRQGNFPHCPVAFLSLLYATEYPHNASDLEPYHCIPEDDDNDAIQIGNGFISAKFSWPYLMESISVSIGCKL